MADNNGQILYSDLIKDDGGLDKLVTILEKINTSYDNLHNNIKGKAIDLKTSTDNLSGATAMQREEITKLYAESQKLKDVENELLKVKKQYADILSRTEKIQAEEIELNRKAIAVYKEIVGNETNLKLTKQELNTVRRNAINYMAQEENSYAQLAAKANLINVALNKMTVEQRTNSEQGKALTAQAKEYTEVLKVQDAAVGRHQRNVGDYGKATARLNFATAQIVRELPVAAMRADMFFLAISNNIPMLADQVTNMKNMNKELIANGKAMEVVSVPKMLLKSLLTWNSVMMIGVTLLTVFGGKLVEWTKKLFENSEEVERNKKKLKENADVQKYIADKAKAAANELATLNLMYKQWTDLKGANLDQRQKWFNDHKDTLGKVGKGYKDLKSLEKDWAVNGIKNYQEGIMKRAEASAAFNKLVELYEKRITLSDKSRTAGLASWQTEYNKLIKQRDDLKKYISADPTNLYAQLELMIINGRISEFNKLMKEGKRATTDYNNQLISEIDKQIIAYSKLADVKEVTNPTPDKDVNKKEIKDYSKEVVEAQKKLTEDVAKNQEEGLQKQLAVNQAKIDNEIATAQEKIDAANKLLKESENTNDKEKILTQKQVSDLKQIITTYTDDIKIIKEKGLKEQLDIEKEFAEKSLDQFNDYTEKLWKETEDRENKLLDTQLLAIDNKYNADVEAATKQIKGKRDLNKALLQLELEMLEAKKLTNEKSLVFDEKLATQLQEQINNVTKKLKSSDKPQGIQNIIAKALGLDEDQMATLVSNLSTAFDTIKQNLSDLLQAYIDFYDAKIDKEQESVNKAQDLVDYEREAKANGYASNVSAAETALANEQAALEKSQKEKEKYVKLQQQIDAAMQVSSLISATANIIASYSKIPFVGLPLAIASIAGMWGTFIAAKSTAAQVTQFAEGGYGVLEGGSHASGNDILLGTTKDGRQLRAEGDEGYGVFNRRMTRKYKKLLPDIVNSINKGVFEEKYLQAYNSNGMSVTNVNLTDTSKMERGINKLVDLNETKTWVDGKGRTIIKYKNRTTIIS